jgi:deoxyribonuclease IV
LLKGQTALYLSPMPTKPQKYMLGAHMSISGGLYNAFTEGERKGCETIQIFVKSSNQWKAKPISDEEIEKYHQEQKRTGISPVVAHDSYLINLGSPNPELLEKSRQAFLVELQRCEKLAIPYLVTHPGSHLESSLQSGIDRVAESLTWLFERTPDFEVKVALETTAGQGSNLGYTFEQLAEMIAKSGRPDRCRVCFDTCHAYAAGYDIACEIGYEQTWKAFERIIGMEKLAAIHLNDSRKGLNSRVDRHEQIGKGTLGIKAFELLMRDKRFENIPKILETPKGDNDEMDEINLKLLRKLAVSDKLSKPKK